MVKNHASNPEAPWRATRSRAPRIKEDAIKNPAVYDELEKQYADIEAQLARALKARDRGAAQARPANGHAENEAQQRRRRL